MKKLLSILLFLTFPACDAKVSPAPAVAEDMKPRPVLLTPEQKASQQKAAEDLVARLLVGQHAASFQVEITGQQENNLDLFELESRDGKIILRGTNGLSACRALKRYLNDFCHCSVSWRGDNLALPDPLPQVPGKIRSASPHKYRYMFNYCVYGYSMPWWRWAEWERMIDVMALNGVNLPLCLLGQEKAWQETYKELGIQPRDLDDFFSGPAWFPWQWMGNLDAWGGPLPQNIIDEQSRLQKKILARCRAFGMTPVLPGFAGHTPKILRRKFPGLKVHSMSWQGFPPTDILSWEDPRFKKIGTTFLKKQRELYGTDHYYAIDPFNEMIPPTMEEPYISNMAKAIFSSMNEADPAGTWVLMTWFCKSPQIPTHEWQKEPTPELPRRHPP